MFRRLWTGLPPTPKFSTDLERLGYFVNEDDQIRNVKDPKYYFKYFLTRNTYYNDCQRFSFHIATQRIILTRLAELGVHPVRLPLGARHDEPHLYVLASSDLATADRVVMFVGETGQDLGVLAHRVISGPGGINEGSIVSMVSKMRQAAGGDESDDKSDDKSDCGKGKSPAILICNPSELFWWPDARRSLSVQAVEGMPRPSAAHSSPCKYAQNTIPGHETADAHIASVFNDLLGRRPSVDTAAGDQAGGNQQKPRITAIAIAGGADALEGFLDHAERWQRWGPHMDSLALLGGQYEEHHIKTDAFRAFLRQRARAYISSEAPVDTPVAGPDGNDMAARATRYGCPVHSAGTTWLTELMYIEAQSSIIEWAETVARDPAYVNPQIAISYAETIPTEEETTWKNYKEEEEAVEVGDETDKGEVAGGGETGAGETGSQGDTNNASGEWTQGPAGPTNANIKAKMAALEVECAKAAQEAN